MMDGSTIKQTLLADPAGLRVPLVFRDMIESWPAREWTPELFAAELGDQKLRFRIGLKKHPGVQFETTCSFVDAEVGQFLEWLREDECSPDNPLSAFPRSTHWGYADYKYMAKIFNGHPHILEAVQWKDFGFAGRDGADSTWWFGSKGASSVCHYDTYGCNLVAQLYGRKRWTLFPPEDSDCLYPTRIPYEESSVFSRVDIANPNLREHTNFKCARRYEVMLEPGQVLLVPRHWWHFVECLDTSISVNTWIELEADQEAKFHEAVTRLLACALIREGSSGPRTPSATVAPGQLTAGSSRSSPLPDTKAGSSVGPTPSDSAGEEPPGPLKWLNPTEELTSRAENFWYIQQIAQLIRISSKSPREATKSDIHPSGPGAAKRPKLDDTKSQRLTGGSGPIFSAEFDKDHVTILEPKSSSNPVDVTDSDSVCAEFVLTERDIVNEILQPNVVKLICENIKKKS